MGDLDIIQINDLSSFWKIRRDWDYLYKSDSSSHIYISWFWLYGLFSSASFKWIVLGVKNVNTSSFVAFLPLKIDNQGLFGIKAIRQIGYSGLPNLTYSGLLSSSDFESKVIHLLSSFIQSNLRWDILNFSMIKDPRLSNLLGMFTGSKFNIKTHSDYTTLNITLPGDYDSFLKTNISRESRWRIRRKIRDIQEDERYRITYSTAETIDRDINALCKLWFNRWKKHDRMEWHRSVLNRYFEIGLLSLSTVWDGNILVSALACLIDPENKTYNLYITSYNPDYSKISPGIVLTAESIKQAIEQNYRFYDFTGGLDRYKLSFGPERNETTKVSIIRKRFKTIVTFMMVRFVKSVLKKLSQFAK